MSTTNDIIKRLQKLDPEGTRVVVVASDGEGNRYRYMFSNAMSLGAGREEGNGDIKVGLEKLTPALKREGYSEEDVIEDGFPVIVLYPE